MDTEDDLRLRSIRCRTGVQRAHASQTHLSTLPGNDPSRPNLCTRRRTGTHWAISRCSYWLFLSALQPYFTIFHGVKTVEKSWSFATVSGGFLTKWLACAILFRPFHGQYRPCMLAKEIVMRKLGLLFVVAALIGCTKKENVDLVNGVPPVSNSMASI